MAARPAPLLLALAALLLAGCLGSTNPPGTGTAGNASDNRSAGGGMPGMDMGGNGSSPVELSVATTGTYPVNPAFDPPKLSAPAGATVHVTLTNGEPNPLVAHNWVLEGVDGAKVNDTQPGAKGDVTFVLPASLAGKTIKFYCSIGDHRQRGMEGDFVVA